MRKNPFIENENYIGFQSYLRANFSSERSIRNYLCFVNSSVVSRVVGNLFNINSIYQIDDFENLLKIYLGVKEDEDNIRLHRVYSAAISKYIRFRFPNKKLRESY